MLYIPHVFFLEWIVSSYSLIVRYKAGIMASCLTKGLEEIHGPLFYVKVRAFGFCCFLLCSSHLPTSSQNPGVLSVAPLQFDDMWAPHLQCPYPRSTKTKAEPILPRSPMLILSLSFSRHPRFTIDSLNFNLNVLTISLCN